MEKKRAQTEQYCFGYNQAIDECIEAVEKAEHESIQWKAELNDAHTKLMLATKDVNLLNGELINLRDEFTRMENKWRNEVDLLRHQNIMESKGQVDIRSKGSFKEFTGRKYE